MSVSVPRLPPLPTEVFADPGRNDWYFRGRKPDSVARFVRDDQPPTLEAALTLPEIAALVEALRGAIEAIDAAYDGPDDNGMYSTRERDALAKVRP